MIAHRHANRAASQRCPDPDCLARYAAALERGAAEIARVDAETTARLHARTAHSTVAWAAIIGQVPAWQAMARDGQGAPICRSCGRTFAPSHDVAAEGPTSRHPFIPA